MGEVLTRRATVKRGEVLHGLSKARSSAAWAMYRSIGQCDGDVEWGNAV